MKVTEVKLFRPGKESIVKAIGKATIDNELVLDVLVMDNGKGPWATFPNGKAGTDGKWYLPVFFKNKEKDTEFKAEVMKAFANMAPGARPTQASQAPVVPSEDLPF